MFSGIVEEMGTVDGINLTSQMKLWDGSIGEGFELTIKSTVAVEEAYIGCSIAVNGVCLTATSYDAHKVKFIAVYIPYLWYSFLSLSTLFGGAVHSWTGTRDTTEVKSGLVEAW